MTAPKLDWPKIWQEFDAWYADNSADFPDWWKEQIPKIQELVGKDLAWADIWVEFQTWHDHIDKTDYTPEWEDMKGKIKELVKEEMNHAGD